MKDQVATSMFEPSSSKSRPSLHKMHSDDDCGNQKHQRTHDPHNDRTEHLVGQRRNMERVRLPQVVAIDWLPAEGEKRRQRCVYDVCHDQVRQRIPAHRVHARRPRPNQWPPEKDGRSKEADVFELVPVLMFERKIISRRHMPAQKDKVHRQPRHQRRSKKVTNTPQHLQPKQRPHHTHGESTGKPAQQRNHRIPKQQKRRHERHQQQMLHHMRAEQRIGKPIERRANRDPDSRETKKERSQSPCGKQRRPCPANGEPATDIDDRGEDQRRSKEDWRRPLRKDGPVLRRHWNRVKASANARPWAPSAPRSTTPSSATHRWPETDHCPAASSENAQARWSPRDSVHCRKPAYSRRPAAPGESSGPRSCATQSRPAQAPAAHRLPQWSGSCGTAYFAEQSLPLVPVGYGHASKPWELDHWSTHS